MTQEDLNQSFENIKTERLLIRKMKAADAEFIFHYRNKPEVFKFLTWRPNTLEEAHDFILEQKKLKLNTAGSWFQLSICIKESGEMIGDCVIHFLESDSQQVEIGYTIAPQFQGNGFATEAVIGLINYIFDKLIKHRITASVDPDNKSSIKLLERIGLRKEAHFKKSLMINNKWFDDVIYAILNEEWTNKR